MSLQKYDPQTEKLKTVISLTDALILCTALGGDNAKILPLCRQLYHNIATAYSTIRYMYIVQ